jgi:hypothetical protein
MEVKIIPISGCMQIFLGVFTLGVAPLAQWILERRWPKEVNENELVTRGGKHILWNEFTKIVKVRTQVTRGSSSTVDHYELYSPREKVIVAVYRLQNGEHVFDYIVEHLPEQVVNPLK